MRNRIINGAMVIDQRNAGASVTSNTTAQIFPVDRWVARGESTDGVFTLQQNAGSVTPPTGFRNYLGATVTTADASIGATQRYEIYQRIEGFNTADLMWGTANAKTVTFSFWVRSSLTGTFGGAFINNDADRSYPFTYTISSADTWEQKSITIAGDTSGSWNTTNGIGIWVDFSLGAGSTRLGTAGAWASSFFAGATGQTNLIATNGATFYITGVQLEVGTQATSFEYRQYTTELQLCQRYGLRVEQQQNTGDTCSTGTNTNVRFIFPTTMRTAPTASLITAGSWILGNGYSANYTASSVSISAQALTAGGGRVNLGGFPTFGSNFFVSGSDAVGTAVMFMSSEL
jgi:hypothetical protein